SRPLHSLQLQTGLDLSDYIKRLATHFANGFMDDTTFGLTGFGYENGIVNASAYYAGTTASMYLGVSIPVIGVPYTIGKVAVRGGMFLAKAAVPKMVVENVKASVATGKTTQVSHEAGKIREFVTTVPKGADSTLFRKAAFREAKEKAGIPRSQQPSNTYHEKIRDQQGHVEGRVYEFKIADESTATIREHTLGHKFGNHGSHFNSELRNAQGIKQSLKNNADSHTYIKQD
ncbi:HNH/endonuclease VII fold putative polymorphic toxin, partial [Fastidiosibacter lacustris]|uniref:HNH/endonuclease VII fold putative polymorphic toxin n=1 Tax=Fastidiosibacter lacustris TaxID=2056695 RepID=UPI00195DB82A